jgi:hypothetical protein
MKISSNLIFLTTALYTKTLDSSETHNFYSKHFLVWQIFNEIQTQTIVYSVQQDSCSVISFAAVPPISKHKGQ